MKSVMHNALHLQNPGFKLQNTVTGIPVPAV